MHLGLIQGPPGTGKTHTVTEILRNIKFKLFPQMISQADVLHYNFSVKKNKDTFCLSTDFCSCLSEILSNYSVEKCQANENSLKINNEHWKITNKFNPVRKILVCAPSNCAIDELMSRVLSSNIFPKNDCLRFGTFNENIPKNVAERHIEKIIKELKKNILENKKPNIKNIEGELRVMLGLNKNKDDVNEFKGKLFNFR